MGFDEGGVDEYQAVLAFFRKRIEDAFPDTAFAPSVVTTIDSRVRSIALRLIPPRCARTQNIKNPVQYFAVVFTLRPAAVFQQLRLNHRPFFI